MVGLNTRMNRCIIKRSNVAASKEDALVRQSEATEHLLSPGSLSLPPPAPAAARGLCTGHRRAPCGPAECLHGAPPAGYMGTGSVRRRDRCNDLNSLHL